MREKNMESGEITTIPVSQVGKWREFIETKRRELMDEFRRLGIDSLVLSYGNHLEDLAKFLKGRKIRRR